MYDSAASDFPPDAQYILAYIDGPYANVSQAMATGAYVVTITIEGTINADCCDIEPGCLTPWQGAQWAAARQQLGLPATQYFSTSQLWAVQDANAAYGVDPNNVYFFGAQYDGIAEIPAGYVAKQYIQGNSFPPGAYDTSVAWSTWPALPQPQIGVNMPQYVRYSGKTGVKTKGGNSYQNGLVAECSAGVATNMGDSWENVVNEYQSLNLPLPIIPDPNGTLLDSYPVHHGF
jgi:hypothetical protein